ncbi:NAD(P)/FAD-dependent oxidoreductase [Corynebacterium sp. TAE3-ERU12]|uniref:phytoene desaturase family protein n=1 Tax=Corynebacterium sp. TAE3-ERU12 TaxID=2849491 RepID=UPI001C467D29|nr:NAD(P)/FAD-dependent oxidoreductase [Corynebacterium sp. TAE3-ERU12]MBV7294791.1 NAD(P)/FAD-dependent oxidoreductase [Corynebacterium sp. TAE3-ERU12]
MPSAAVVGSGPNGLAAAIRLAQHGVAVTVYEAAATPGGGLRSAELLRSGVVHDVCSAVHPMALASPFFRYVGLRQYGLEFVWPEVDLVHPLADGSAGVLYRNISRTAAGLGVDAAMWQWSFGGFSRRFDKLLADALQPPVHVPHRPFLFGAFGANAALAASWSWRRWRTAQATALFAGIAGHAFTRLDTAFSASVGHLLTVAAHAHGWPVAVGGSQAIADAMVAKFRDLGGIIETNAAISDRGELGDVDIVMLDTSPQAAARILGNRQPARLRSAYQRFRHGAAAVKVDFVTNGAVPWTNPEARRAGTVHVCGTAGQVAAAERQCARGIMPERPLVIVGQQHLADPSRCSGSLQPLWAYAHVPAGYGGDATTTIIDQIERCAPGFRDTIVATHTMTTSDMEAYNPNYVGGDIIGGDSGVLQLLARPVLRPDPYFTGVAGVYLCSASTPPGAGVHGMCGANAADRALRELSQ